MQKEVLLIMNSSYIQRSWYGANNLSIMRLPGEEYDEARKSAREIFSSNNKHKICAWQVHEEDTGSFGVIKQKVQIEKRYSINPKNFLQEIILN